MYTDSCEGSLEYEWRMNTLINTQITEFKQHIWILSILKFIEAWN